MNQTGDAMRRALLLSGAFHVVLLTAFLVGLPGRSTEPPADTAITVEIMAEPTRLAKTPAAEPAESAPLPERRASSPTPRPAPPVKPKAAPPEPSETAQAKPEAPEPAPPVPQQLAAPAEPPEAPPPSAPPPRPAETPAPAPARIAEPLPAPLETPVTKPEAPKPVEEAAVPPQPVPAVKPKPPEPAKTLPAKVEQARSEPPEVPSHVAVSRPMPRPAETAQKAAPAKPPPKVEARTEEPKKPAAPEDSFAALLKSVEQMNKRERSTTTRSGKGSAAAAGAAAGTVRGTGPSAAEINAIGAQAARQMEGCWKIQAGLPGIDKIQPFAVSVEFNPDGTAARVDIVDKSRLSSDPLFRVVAESAQRAAWSCRLTLPRDRFDVWHTITFNFDPKTAVTG